MSEFSFHDLVRSAGRDGSSVPLGTSKPTEMDLGELLQAWSIERSHSIECEILLNLSRMAIARLVATNLSQSADERQDASDLIQQIENRLQKCPTNRA